MALNRFGKIMEKYGLEQAVGSNFTKREKEAAIVGNFALCLTNVTGLQYWLGIPGKNDTTPDCYLTWTKPDKDNQAHLEKFTLSVEVVEYETHSKSIVSVLSKKLDSGLKRYPDDFILLCCLYGGSDKEIVDIQGIHQYVLGLSTNIKEVWLLFEGIASESGAHGAVMVYPEIKEIRIDALAEAKRNAAVQHGFRKFERGVLDLASEPRMESFEIPLP